ncbi:MAG TPA: choice-of-anchor D domain-containing protein, partial [Chromatiaceae bacterium]|nr:choice-of-anchor D domain-containing protein [Chromatiaceae bacterium]
LAGSIYLVAANAGTIVQFPTSMGSYFVQLNDPGPTATVTNFQNYVDNGKYDNTFVHRVATLSTSGVDVIQGGGFSFDPSIAPGTFTSGSPALFEVNTEAAIANEFNESNLRGTIAMARQGGVIDSATSEWFINTSDNTSLDTIDEGFTVFGRVAGDGIRVVDAIFALAPNDIENLTFANPVLASVPTINHTVGDPIGIENLVTTHGIRVEFSIDNEAHDFGSYAVGSTTNTTFTLTNLSGAAINLTVALDDDIDGASPFSITTDTCTGGATGDGFTCQIQVDFSPLDGDTFDESFDITIVGHNVPAAIISLDGVGQEIGNPAIGPSFTDLITFGNITELSLGEKTRNLVITNYGDAPLVIGLLSLVTTHGIRVEFSIDNEAHDFGSYAVGSTTNTTFTLTNLSGAAINLTVALDDDIDGASPFSITTDTCTGGATGDGFTCQIQVDFSPLDGDTFDESFDITIVGHNVPAAIISLDGVGQEIGNPAIGPSFTDLITFGNITELSLGEKTRNLVITNYGDAPLVIGLLSLSGAQAVAYEIQDDLCSSATLTNFEDSCTVAIIALQIDSTLKEATLHIPSDDPGGQINIELIANHPIIRITPPTRVPAEEMGFGAIPTNATLTQRLPIQSFGNTDLVFGSIDITGVDSARFSIGPVDECSNTSLATVDVFCNVDVKFDATGLMGDAFALLTINNNSPLKSAFEIELTGTGDPTLGLTITPSVIDFGQLAQGGISSIVVTLQNDTTVDITIDTPNGITVSGPDAVLFGPNPDPSDCDGVTLLTDVPCAFTLDFSLASMPPTELKTASLDISTSIGTQSVPVSGTSSTGPIIALSTPQLDLGTVNFGDTSASQSVTVTNTGLAPLTIAAISLLGNDDPEFIASNDCLLGPIDAEGGTCTINITYSGIDTGTDQVTLTIDSDDPLQPTIGVTLDGETLAPLIRVTINGALVVAGSGDAFDFFVGLEGVAESFTIDIA